jgi:hypothetical protein
MSDAPVSPEDPDAGDGDDDADDTPPDESTLMGASGVEAEVLAELARAEGEMSDPSAPDNPDAAGAQV